MTHPIPWQQRVAALLLALVALALPLVLAACGSSEAQGGQRGSQGPQPFPVVELGRRSITLTSDYPATLEGEQTVEIRPRTEGYITQMNVDEGDAVQRGQVLFRLNSEDEQQAVRSAQADVEAAQANVQTARDEVERIQALVEQDIISNYELKAARNALQERRATLNQRQAQLTNAQVDLGYTTIRSPADGVIGDIPYRIGSLVSSTIQQPLTVVSDVSEVYAYFSMGEGELLEMNQATGEGGEGQQRAWQRADGTGETQALRRRIEALPKVNLVLTDGSVYPLEGDVRLASGLINTRTGSASFRATFDNPNRILRSGATANVRLPFRRSDAIVVPKSATYDIQDQRYVYRVPRGQSARDTSVIRSTPIQVASLSTDKLYVVESGLSASDRIVTEGIGTLSDSTAVIPQPVDADSLFQALTARNQRAREIVSAEGGSNTSGPPDFGSSVSSGGDGSNASSSSD